MELVRREAYDALTTEMRVFDLIAVEDEQGRTFDARLHGAVLAQNDQSGATAFILEDGQLAVHVSEDQRNIDYNKLYIYGQSGYPVGSESEWLCQWFSIEQVIEIMKKLGKRAVINIGTANSCPPRSEPKSSPASTSAWPTMAGVWATRSAGRTPTAPRAAGASKGTSTRHETRWPRPACAEYATSQSRWIRARHSARSAMSRARSLGLAAP